ncbi:ComF family protein [Gemella sp. 19428wG2_WT2a]|nr:ComF family protein [Gemella sp. 19428wG2_WT2a]TFU60040.1 ComF family protein [Gemella sp. WT2a]
MAHYEFIKDKIYSIKYFGDIKKAESFKAALNNFLQKNHFDLVLIAPSNRTREAIRGFNHVKIICDIAEIPYKDIFIEPYRLKQSKLYSERKYHNFSLNKDFTNNIISAKSILIIDDIFTSGNTLESLALVLLKINKELKISFLCLGKS